MTAEQEEAAQRCAYLARRVETLRGFLKHLPPSLPADIYNQRQLTALELELREAQTALNNLTKADDDRPDG